MTRKRPPYIQIVEKNLRELSEEFKKGKTIADFAIVADSYASYYFYLGEIQRGKEASYWYSKHNEKLLEGGFASLRENRLSFLFDVGLYRSLAHVQAEAEVFWQKLVEARRRLLPDEMIDSGERPGGGRFWIQEAYALVKLHRFEEASLAAEKGFQALLQGKGLYPEPRENSIEYGLAGVIQALASYQRDPGLINKEHVQQALLEYKAENLAFGRLGYPVIFDLQFSYPEIITPVLPGPDPYLD